MGKKNEDNEIFGHYTIKKISRMAQALDDYTTMSKSFNTIYGTMECDVTDIRNQLGEKKISFTAFLVACFSRVVEEHKFPMNTLSLKKSKFYIFDDVDCMINIEKTLPSGLKKPVNYTVRKSQTKSLLEIHNEIRAAQKQKAKLSAEKKKGSNLAKIFPKLPRFIRRIIIRRMFSHPMMKKKLMGTVGVTSVGMGTKGSGFMIHITPHTASLGVGGIGTHVVMVDGNPVEHYFVSLTCAMNHQIVDGAPAARFMNQLRIMIEKGCLEDNVDWCLKSI